VILFRLLALPVTAPAAGIRYCLEKAVEFAEQQLTDDTPVREELLELQLALEEGRVTDEEYTQREAALVARLARSASTARKRRVRAFAAQAPAEDEERTVVIEIPEELE